MTTTNTRRVIRRRIYDEIPILGFAGTADSVAVGSITDSLAFQDSNLSVQHFRGTYIYRPDRTDDDRVKKAGNITLASGLLAHTGTNYGNTSDMVYEIVGVLHPDELNACLQRAQRRIYFETQVPLTLITDGDMSSSATTDWTATNTSHSKITTAGNVFSGLRSSRVANTSADGNIQSGTVRVSRGEYVWMSAVVRCDVGTAELILYDVTNSTELAAVTTTEEHWTHLYYQGNVGATTEEIALRLQGTENTADIYWDHAILYRVNDRRVFAPSWVDEHYKLLKVRQAEYAQALSSTTGTGGAHMASSRYFRDWSMYREVSLDPFHPESNAYALQFNRAFPLADIWLEGRRPFSDLEPLTNDTDTTLAPLELVVAYAKMELADLLVKRFPNDPKWMELKQNAMRETEAEAVSRPQTSGVPIRHNTGGRI